MPRLRMDLPVVRLERLPDEVIAKYLNKDMKVYKYNHGYKQLQQENFPSKKHARSKPYWVKRGTIHAKFYNNTVYHKHSSSKIVANGFYNSFHEQNVNSNQLYSTKDKFRLGQRKGNNIVLVPNHFHNSGLQTVGSQVSSEVENARTFSNNQDRSNNIVSNEQLLKQGEKVSRKEVTYIEDCEDGTENLTSYDDFNSHDWQIVSEASCSDVSSEASPSHENLDAEYSIPTEAEINETSSKHKITLSSTTCIDDNSGKLQDSLCSPNSNLSKIIQSDDDDDRLTEPYRSEGEEDSKVQDIDSPKSLKSLRIKLTGSHKNGFTNITNEHDKLPRNKLKAIATIESKDESNISKQGNAWNMKISPNIEKSTESTKNGQGVTSKETKFSRYDYVGLIMQTMDKSGPYSVNAKSDDAAQKPHGAVESNFRSSNVNKLINYKETSGAANGKELPEIPYLKQRKARMSRPATLTKTKSFLCRDLKGGTAMNKPHLNYMSRPINMSEPKSSLLVKDNIQIGERNVDTAVSSGTKTLNSTIVIDKQGVRPLVTKMPMGRRCWRCGKPFGNNSNITDRLCKQCNAFDYTTVTQRLTNIQASQKTKDNDCNSKLFKISYTQPKTKNLSEAVTSIDKNKLTEGSFHCNATSLLHHINEENSIIKDRSENENLSPLKLKVSLGSNNKFIEKANKDVVAGDMQIKKLKKKRMRSASDTVEGIYEASKRVAVDSEHANGGNLIYRITKRKGKHKELSKKRKKIKVGAEDEGSDISGYYSEDNITSKCTSKELSSEAAGEKLPQSATNQVGNNVNSSAKTVLNKTGNCEVRSVNKGLFLLSFSETGEENYQLESVLGEYSRKQSSQSVTKQDSGIETNSAHSKLLLQSGNKSILSHKSGFSEQTDLPPLAVATICTEKPTSTKQQSCPTFLDLQSLVNTSESAVTAVFQNVSPEQNNSESGKLQEAKNNFCDDTDSENKLSTLRIESVYSLQDTTASENVLDEKRTNGEKAPYLLKYNTANELDAYTTASILDMDGTKERSLTVLMSLLNREYKGLQYVCQLLKKSDIIKVDLHAEKQRHIENIRTLQLACALFKKCQKCNKELSHEMLGMKSHEISQLLSECGNTMSTELTVTEKNDVEKESLSEMLENSDKKEEDNKNSDGNCTNAKEHRDVEVKEEDRQPASHAMTEVRKTVKFLLEEKVSSPTTEAPALERKSDDDVICLGVSHLPKSSVQTVRSPNQQGASQSDSSNCVQQSVEAAKNSQQNSVSPHRFSPSVVPPNVSVIKAHGLASSPTISNFISSSNSIPLQVIPGVNHPLQTAANVVSNAITYQKAAANCYVKHPNYSLPAYSLSVQKESTNSLKQLYVVSQLNKLPNGTTWIPSSIQPQWTSHPNQGLASSPSTSEALTNLRNQGWRNNSPLQSNTPPSVPNQQKPVQQIPVGSSNPMLPLISQFGAAVSAQHAVHAGIPVQATRALPPVPPMYSHSAIKAWHQPSNPLAAAAIRQTQQTPVVCIACRKPIGMTCPTGMFCSDVCKKSYCAHFPNYR